MAYVYVISVLPHRRPCKIGIARNPVARLGTLQVGNHSELELSGVCLPRAAADDVERLLHQEFSDCSLRGEWFDVGAATVTLALAQHGWVGWKPNRADLAKPMTSGDALSAVMAFHPRYAPATTCGDDGVIALDATAPSH